MSETYKLKRSASRRSSSSGGGHSRTAGVPGERLASLDAFRGFIMIILAAHGFGLAHFADLPATAPAWTVADYDIWQTIGHHFRHARWVTVDTTYGVAFWDLIQPAFMFMVGVAMPFSNARRTAIGNTSRKRLGQALIRAVVLVLMGVFLYSLRHPRTNWIFPNVLAQIGLGYFFVFLLLNRTVSTQLTAIAAILVGYWALFYFTPPPNDYNYTDVNASVEHGEVFDGFMSPWSKNANAAFRFDQWLLPHLRTPPAQVPVDDESASEKTNAADDSASAAVENTTAAERQPRPTGFGFLRRWFFSNPEPYAFNRGGYTTLNFVPSIATALLGVLCGQLLTSQRSTSSVVTTLLVGGAVCVGLGLAAHVTICPIVKRIWTPSWTLFSGGCVIWMLALFYVLFDVLPFSKLSWPLQMIGMNSLAVYFMGELLSGWVGDQVVAIHLTGFLQTIFSPDTLDDAMFGRIIQPTMVALVFWLLCVWMYRKRIFVRV